VTIELELDGTRRRLTLRREHDRWRVEIDGRELAVSVVESGSPVEGVRWSLLIGPSAVLPPEGGHEPDHPLPDGASGFLTAGASAKTVSLKSYEIAFEAAPGGEVVVHVNGIAVPLTVVEQRGSSKRRATVLRGGGAAGSDTGPRAVVAPMPGRIVKVLVQPGEAVQARQGLVVVEAMKMENEVRAPHAGIVADVRVREGSSVEANAVLVVLT
jgi:biotin carboxyl carrier protein